uniref:Serpentine Receptor, class H n=1 Tax=Panagrellus redivivus TaxID=6233 RepID=A0A7E4UV11_PANRE
MHSKSLGTFKYYLLNQTIWAQLLETVITVYSPVFLCPYISGFQSGFLRTVASPQLTNILSIFGYCFFINTVLGVFLSLLNRLIFTFHPNLKRYLHNKYTFAGIIVLHLTMHFLVAILMLNTMEDAIGERKIIIAETQNALQQFFKEPSLIYVSEYGGFTRLAISALFFLIVIFNCILLFCVTVFIINVVLHRKTSRTISNSASPLIVSSLVQSFLCLTLLFLPAGCLTFVWGFRIENSANVVNALFFLANIHGTVDMFCILIFVKPYRSYCYKLFSRVGRKVTGQSSIESSGVPMMMISPVNVKNVTVGYIR